MKEELLSNGMKFNSAPSWGKPIGRAFYDISKFPELYEIEKNYKKIKKEVISKLNSDDLIECEGTLGDPLNINEKTNDWTYFDSRKHPDFIKKLKITNQYINKLSTLNFWAISIVKAGDEIKHHKHFPARASCILTLETGDNTYIECNGERKYFKEGKFTIMNYGYVHGVVNKSNIDRLVILINLNLPGVYTGRIKPKIKARRAKK